MKAHHISGKFAHGFTLLSPTKIFLSDLVTHILEVEVDIEILQEAAVANFPKEGTERWSGVAESMAAEVDGIRDSFEMGDHGGIDASWSYLRLILLDEKLVVEELLESNPLLSVPSEESFD